MDRPMKMNWGCGPVVADDWINVDIAHVELDGYVYASTLGFADETFDGIVANHSLQCLLHDQLDPAVREFHRVLRPGGRLRVLVPDVLAAFCALESIDWAWPGFVAISEDWSLEQKFAHYLTWGGQNRSCFTPKTLRELLARNGFGDIDFAWDDMVKWDWLRALDSRLGESIVMEFGKP